MSHISEPLRAEASGRRSAAEAELRTAQRLAADYGLRLCRCAAGHYQLRSDGLKGWILNIYPGKQRLLPDVYRKPPKVILEGGWGLAEVVIRFGEAEMGGDS